MVFGRIHDEIDFSGLPDKFVLKANHGFGKTILVGIKSELDIAETRLTLKNWLKEVRIDDL
jgi:hypothetical protein